MAHKNIPLIDRTSTSTQFNGNLLPVGTASLGTAGAPWATGTIVSVTGNLTGSAARAIIATTATSASYGLSSSFSSTGASASYAQSASAAISSSRAISSSAALSSSTAISSSYASTYPIITDGYNEYVVSNTWGASAETPLALYGATTFVSNSVVYFFGTAQNGRHIYTSSLTSPAKFATFANALPTASGYSVCTRVGDNLYIFGSRNSGGTISSIFSASVNNPLTWSYVGDLPLPLWGQQLVTLNNGQDLWMFNGANASTIFTASMYATASNPLSWSLVPITGNYTATFERVTLVLGDKIWSYGGDTSLGGGSVTNAVYTASVSTPSQWGQATSGLLTAGGERVDFLWAREAYAIIGNYVYVVNGPQFNPHVNRITKISIDQPLSASFLSGLLPIGVQRNSVYVAQGKLCSAYGTNGVSDQTSVFTASIVDLGRTAFTSGSGTDISSNRAWITQSNYWTVMPAWPITASCALTSVGYSGSIEIHDQNLTTHSLNFIGGILMTYSSSI